MVWASGDSLGSANLNDQSVNTMSTGTLWVTETRTPSGASSGVTGTITWDTDYIYVCTSTDSWQRATLAAF